MRNRLDLFDTEFLVVHAFTGILKTTGRPIK